MELEPRETLQKQKKRRYLGIRRLRLMLMLFVICLFLYSFISYMLLELMLENSSIIYLNDLLIHGAAILLWLMIVRMLWSCRRIARTLFQLAAIANLYTCYELVDLFQVNISEESTLLRIVLAAMVVGKAILALYISRCLYRDVYIAGIWKSQPPEEGEEALQPKPQRVILQHDHRIDARARNRIRACSMALLLYQYGMLVVLYLLLFVLRSFLQDEEGLLYIQRILLLASLFSAFIWSFPIVLLFLYKPFSRIAIALMWILELVRLLYKIPPLVDIFYTQHYEFYTWGLLILLDAVRYFFLYQLLHSFLNDPFIRVYWMRRYHESIQEDQEL